jgi:tetratricopeptide (TPR) repeat protein
MRRCLFVILLCASAVALAQNSAPSTPANSKDADSASKSTSQRTPNLEAPRSDRVNANDLGDTAGRSSSKETQIDLSPPPDDTKAHPKSSEIISDVDGGPAGDVNEMHPWDPHRAAKDIEVGDFYFKRKNYKAAEDRYREALYYKDNDALATYRLAECLEKLGEPDEAVAEFENYLKILPNGPQAEDSRKSIARLKAADAGAKAAK